MGAQRADEEQEEREPRDQQPISPALAAGMCLGEGKDLLPTGRDPGGGCAVAMPAKAKTANTTPVNGVKRARRVSMSTLSVEGTCRTRRSQRKP